MNRKTCTIACRPMLGFNKGRKTKMKGFVELRKVCYARARGNPHLCFHDYAQQRGQECLRETCPAWKKIEKHNASLDRPAASAGTVGGVVGGLNEHG